MNNQKAIYNLAEQLGTTSKYLWSVLLKQAPVDATITVIQISIILIFVGTILKIHKDSLIQKERGSGCPENKYENSENHSIIMSIMGCVSLILLALCFFSINDVVNGYFNPEYWALDKVLSAIKGK